MGSLSGLPLYQKNRVRSCHIDSMWRLQLGRMDHPTPDSCMLNLHVKACLKAVHVSQKPTGTGKEGS